MIAESVSTGKYQPLGWSQEQTRDRRSRWRRNWEPGLIDREIQDQQRSEEERRHRVENEGQAGQDVVDRLVAPYDLENAERNGDDDREEDGSKARGAPASSGVSRR